MGGGQCAECQKKNMGVGGQPLQTKLAISEPGDVYEQEADGVAEQVMRMSPVDVSKRQKIGMTQSLVQRRASGSATGLAEPPPTVYDVLNSPGQPLDMATRAFFEPRFGQDFSQVRVHTGSTAEKSAGNLNAHAYTVGHDIVFANGQFSPGMYEGRRLIVHELTHVLQQRDGSAAERVQRRETKYSKGPSTEFLQVGWNDVYELGIVYKEGTQAQGGGVNLRKSPGGEMIRWLPQNTKVFILKHSVKHKAYAVSVINPDGGTGEFGYVAATHIWRNLPDPDSDVFKIKAGQSPIMIATLHYLTKGFNVWAKDLRYVVNALVWVNQQAKHNAKGPSGISKEAISDEWYTAKSTADVYIWLPGVDFMNAIYETVAEHGGGTGSITGDLWQKVKKVGYWIAYGLAFVGGLVHGFVKSLWDAVVGLAEMIVDVIVSIFTAKVLSDAKELWEAVSKMTWQDIKDSVGAWADKWEKKLNSKDSWTAGHAHGYLTGYVMAEAAQLLVTAGTLTAAKGALWGSRLGKAIQRTRGFKALVTGLEELGGPASKTRKLVGETREALKVTKVFTTLKVAREWAMRTLKLSAEFAKDLSLDAINRLGRLSEAMWKRLSRLSETAKRVLFGCASPCKCDTDAIRKMLDTMTDEDIERVVANIDVPSVKGKKKPWFKEEGKRIPVRKVRRFEAEDIPLRQGEKLKDAVNRVHKVIGTRVSDHTVLREAWGKARAKILARHTLSRENAKELYDKTRDEFWKLVRSDETSLKTLRDAGFYLPEKPGAPYLGNVSKEVPIEEIRISLDHSAEKAIGENWKKALDADNLEFEFQSANSYREIVQMRHRELRQNK